MQAHPLDCTLSVAIVLLAALGLCGCSEPAGPTSTVEHPDLGPALAAGFDAPILLTFTAARERSRYLEDEGYTLTRDDAGVVSFVTDTAGDLGFAFRVDGEWVTAAGDAGGPTIQHTHSDGVVYDFELAAGLRCEVRFVVATSRVAAVELVLENETSQQREVTVMPWLRRCGDASYLEPAAFTAGLSARHEVEPDFLLTAFAPGTYLEELADALIAPGQEPSWASLAECGASVADDVTALSEASGAAGDEVAMLALRFDVSLPPRQDLGIPLLRATVDAERGEPPEILAAELAEAQTWTVAELLVEGAARLAAIPELPELTGDAALVYRSCFLLLQGLMLPAEGNLAHDYYVFSREPTWWFARLGQHVHESLAMILLAHLDPQAAMASHRVFMDRVEADGYLPYNIGPVVEQTSLGTASAPFFSYVAWEIAQVAGDETFLADAYAVGAQLHEFWLTQRDQDGDGLAEWGGYGITESVRDLENVIWDNVAPPERVEAIGLNTLLVMDANALAAMADALGLTDEADEWAAQAAARAELINTQLWDEDTGFYYHVARDTNDFSYAAPDDLKRMEIAGLLPLWAGFVPADRQAILLGHLTDPALFWRTGGIPGLAATDEYYDPAASQCCRWRGPVWVQWQWLLLRGLLDLGEDELAVELTRRTLEDVRIQLAAVHQFRELYDPDDPTAANNSMPNYIWSAMVALMMLETDELRDQPW